METLGSMGMYNERVAAGLYVSGTAGPPPDASWNEFCALVRDDPSDMLRVMVHSHGGIPTLAQRRALAQAIGRREAHTAVITQSMEVRGMVSTVAWFFRNDIKAFAPEAMGAAMAHLQVDPAHEPLLRAAFKRMTDAVEGR